MWIERTRTGEGWPERFAWASFSGGLLGLLLLCLLVWVEQLDGGPPDVATRPAPGAVLVAVEAARAELRVPERDFAVTVPLSAVLRTAGRLEPYCYVAGPGPGNGIARERRLVLGAVLGDRVVVRVGLAPGEPVVIRGQDGVIDGSALLIEASQLDALPIAIRSALR
jgi:hypothetical protein